MIDKFKSRQNSIFKKLVSLLAKDVVFCYFTLLCYVFLRQILEHSSKVRKKYYMLSWKKGNIYLLLLRIEKVFSPIPKSLLSNKIECTYRFLRKWKAFFLDLHSTCNKLYIFKEYVSSIKDMIHLHANWIMFMKLCMHKIYAKFWRDLL